MNTIFLRHDKYKHNNRYFQWSKPWVSRTSKIWENMNKAHLSYQLLIKYLNSFGLDPLQNTSFFLKWRATFYLYTTKKYEGWIWEYDKGFESEDSSPCYYQSIPTPLGEICSWRETRINTKVYFIWPCHSSKTL